MKPGESKMRKFVYYFLIWCMEISLLSCDVSFVNSTKTNDNISESRGFVKEPVLFPSASTIGILAAIAVPLSNRKNVFVSYNFEANYNSPFSANQILPGVLTRLDLVNGAHGGISRSLSSSDTTVQPPMSETDTTELNSRTDSVEPLNEPAPAAESPISKTVRRSIVTRRNLYKTIEKKLDAAGFNGHECLLRTICEAAEIPLGLHNGVLGDIMHIVFTPSTSSKEDILYDFYDAEIHGSIGMCKHYKKNCPKGIFDMISVLVKRSMN